MTGSVDGTDTVSNSLIGPQQIADDSQTDTTGDKQKDKIGDTQTGGHIKQKTLDVDNHNLETGVLIFYQIFMTKFDILKSLTF